MRKQRELNMFLLTIVKTIFQDMVSMDTVILKIMMFARKLVSADRASLFLVDGKSHELYARIFDVSSSQNDFDEVSTMPDIDLNPEEIRFPIGKGIAGYVAMTGESLNISDAYNDKRFNRSVDQRTGYNTKNLLCMPIFTRGNVIGVVQMVNKSDGAFTKDDEEAFATFAGYCGLALHHARLYEKIRRSEQKHKVALEILSYHNTCREDEVKALKQIKLSVNVEQLKNFDFNAELLSSDEKVLAAIFMLQDLPNVQKFVKIDQDSLMRFALTVRKNYRRVPYHNWTHGFSVANSVYALLKSNSSFKPLEELALYVACLCHDLDHRGKTNQFLVSFASPLASIYSTSVLEHHHFNMTVSILQQDGHNILSNLTSSEYKKVLYNIKNFILATDLSSFFPNKAKLSQIVESNLFDWDSQDHRLLLEALIMTACDLCGSSKGWDQQKQIVEVIFEEFYNQGDVEKSQGMQPLPIMDRSKSGEQPDSQVGFLKGICIPCYELLHALIPESKPMLNGCLIWRNGSLLLRRRQKTLPKLRSRLLRKAKKQEKLRKDTEYH
ncbi:probable 3',5'-cyclic phosphodiesterase pde-5 isoform X2 [Parasteatoda tepidariorum]|uniref:probable 3',5'-cyclic phosphodiesterase pde-5 isoform X2 n=1 Tax=Parasteatoda tepidariorum TaxID=114398 RepID=UPI0039BCBD0D